MAMNLFKNNWDNPITQERLDLVFENRNHDYGAYTLRRDYSRTVLRAFLATFGFAALLAGGPYIWNLLHPANPIKLATPDDIIYKFTEVILPETKQITLPEEKQPQNEPSQKPSGSEQFTNLKASDTDSSNIKTQDLLSTTNLGTKTIKSDSSVVKDPLPPDPKPASNTGFTKWAQVMPSFPGGEAAMLDFLRKNIHYPASAREIDISGKVYLSFIVSSSGEISNVQVLHGIGGGCEEEAVRVVKKMPAWNPGLQNGNPVNVQFTLPISFQLK